MNALPLIVVYNTIQGEGFFTGTPAVFIRLGGCDVGCHWCDTKDSWDASRYKNVSVKDIVNKSLFFTPKSPEGDLSAPPSGGRGVKDIAVITGGEPLMHNLDTLTRALIQKGFKTHLETSGAFPISGKWHWICLSPKKAKLPLKEIYGKADELKVIVYNKHDFRWAQEQSEKVKNTCKIFLQPEWGRKDKMMPMIIEYAKNNPQWRISVQVHKYLNVP